MTTRCRKAILFIEILGVCGLLMACGSPPSQESGQPASQAQPAAAERKQYDLKGKVVGVDTAGKKVAVDGEDIPGFMGAMTMSYPVKDEKLLTGLAAGDQITAKVISSGGDYWLEDVAVVAKGAPK